MSANTSRKGSALCGAFCREKNPGVRIGSISKCQHSGIIELGSRPDKAFNGSSHIADQSFRICIGIAVKSFDHPIQAKQLVVGICSFRNAICVNE